MKKLFFILLASLCLPASASVKQTLDDQQLSARVIPAIKSWQPAWNTFTLSSQTRILYTHETMRPAAQLFADYMRQSWGLSLQVVKSSKTQKGDVLFKYKKQKKAETYAVNIKDEVVVTADVCGALHAVQTLHQMMVADGKPVLQQGKIADYPDYPIRGFMIDCGRKFIPMSYLRNLVRTMAYYKLNTLHVHLNDNGFKQFFHNDWNETYAAFRLQSERFPELTSRDGFYTKDEFRNFVKESAALGVEIIPEIDVPAHSLAFTHYRPSLASKEFGMDHLDLANPAVQPFLDSVFTEYLEGPDPVFAGPKVHVGTDEYSNKYPETVAQFRALTDHLIRLVEKYNKRPLVWGALTHANGETPVKVDNVLMYIWYNGYANPEDMHKKGYQMVSIPDGSVYIVPAAGYYYDYLNIPYLYKQWTPAHIGNKTFTERDPQIEGGMFAVWNDIVGNGISVADIHHRVFPGLQVMAEKCWAPDTTRTWNEWNALRQTLGEAPGVNDLGRYPRGVVVERSSLSRGQLLPIEHIGYPYRVSFDIEYKSEARGTVLFRSSTAEVYLSDPVSGQFGFVRDGYLFTFKHWVVPGKKEHIAIEGDNRETRLFVNGKLVETLGPDERINAKKDAYKIIRTLRFPLQQAGTTFESTVTNLKAESL